MEPLNYFIQLIDKKRILKALKSSESSKAYNDTMMLFESIIDRLPALINGWTGYQIIRIKKPYDTIKAINAGSKIGIAGVSLGSRISEESSRLFEEGEYLEGYLLDLVSDELIFQMGNTLKMEISQRMQTEAECIRVVTPGEGQVSLIFQQEILEDLKKSQKVPIELTESMMLKPAKSMLLMVGEPQSCEASAGNHFCQSCSLKDCLFRDDPAIEVSILGKEEIIINHQKEDNLLNSILKRIDAPSPCGGNGKCGKCAVKFEKGSTNITEADRQFFSQMELDAGYRLACCAYPQIDCSVTLAFEELKDCSAEVTFLMNVEKPKPGTKLVRVEIEEKPKSFVESVQEQIMEKEGIEVAFTLSGLKAFSEITGGPDHHKNAILAIRKEKIIAAFAEPAKIYGLAIDIGTTTIALALLNLENGKIISSHSVVNKQKMYGADVISRILYASKSHEHMETIKYKVVESLQGGIGDLCQKAGINRKHIMETVIAGNTTMTHLLLGLSCYSLGQSPFTPVAMSTQEYALDQLIELGEINTPAMIMPGVSGFVGGDIVSGLWSCNMHKDSELSMLIDLGTNGEMVIGGNGKMLCLSTAAGPALEGASISRGMASVRGAINTVRIQGEKVYTTIIGGEVPVGICGSGVVDIVSEALRCQMIDDTGKLLEKYGGSIIIARDIQGEDILFTQKDIREVQLAKAAIRTGIEILIRQFGCSENDIRKIYLSGGFGNRTSQKSLLKTGILPSSFEKRLVPIGNGALAGAVKALINSDLQEDLYAIMKKIKHIDASKDPDFNHLFVEHMSFEGDTNE